MTHHSVLSVNVKTMAKVGAGVKRKLGYIFVENTVKFVQSF